MVDGHSNQKNKDTISLYNFPKATPDFSFKNLMLVVDFTQARKSSPIYRFKNFTTELRNSSS